MNFNNFQPPDNEDPRDDDQRMQDAIDAGWCPVCRGENFEHKPGCEQMPGDFAGF